MEIITFSQALCIWEEKYSGFTPKSRFFFSTSFIDKEIMQAAIQEFEACLELEEGIKKMFSGPHGLTGLRH